MFSVFGSNRAIIDGSSLAGSGALGVLVLAFVAAQGWESAEKVKAVPTHSCDAMSTLVHVLVGVETRWGCGSLSL